MTELNFQQIDGRNSFDNWEQLNNSDVSPLRAVQTVSQMWSVLYNITNCPLPSLPILSGVYLSFHPQSILNILPPLSYISINGRFNLPFRFPSSGSLNHFRCAVGSPASFLPEPRLRHRCRLPASCCCGSPPSPARLSAVQPFIWCQLRQMKLNLALPARWILWRLCGVYLIQIGQDGFYLPCQTNRYSLAQTDRFKTKGPEIIGFFFFLWHENNSLFLPCLNSTLRKAAFLPQLKQLTLCQLFQISIGFLFLSARFISPQVPQVTQISGMWWYYSPFIVHSQLWERGKWWKAKASVCFSGIVFRSQVGHDCFPGTE